MGDLSVYHQIGRTLMDKLKLTTYPIAVKMIAPEEQAPEAAVQPSLVFGGEVPACLVYTYCRRSGASFYLTKADIACKPIVLYFGFETLSDPEDLYRAWAEHAGYKCTMEAEKQSRAEDVRFEPFRFKGFVLSPLHQSLVKPDVVMLFGSPLVLSHLILAATYDGSTIVSRFNGMESSCKEGIIRTFLDRQCQVVSPGMGDRVLAGVQDHEMIFSIPEEKLPLVTENLFKAGNRIQDPSPFSMPHVIPTLGPNRILGEPVEAKVWPTLRKKIG
ncbi:MAG TPA: DUF169 domain-containing protein [Thermodesulfobacteriota bacterium]|nr:DUF169 domain-containing protein [Thermodesulfobacteriota bacterium]